MGMDGLAIAVVAVAFYIAWNIGSNDSANAMGTAVGSGILSFRQATLTIAIFVIMGAYLRGYRVMKTVGKGIVPSGYLSMEMAVIALLAAGIWVTIATVKGLPVSTTQSIVGGVIGVGLAVGAPINWFTMFKIASAWVLSPILSGVLAIVLYRFYSWVVSRLKSASTIEALYKALAVLGGSYMAFNFGTNEVANASGPIVGAGFLEPKVAGVMVAMSLAIGSLTFSYAVMHTVGKKITSLGPISAFAAQFGSAISVSLANVLGLPVSSSQSIVGGVVGVGLLVGEGVERSVVRDILFGWVATPLTAIFISFVVFKLFAVVGLV